MARKPKRARRTEPRLGAEANADGHSDRDDVAPPLMHAAPDAELAEAQIVRGAAGSESRSRSDEAPESPVRGLGAQGGVGAEEPAAGGLSTRPPAGVAPGEKVGVVTRLVGFLQGSWRELQRVQWPDRRQVFQATGVVIGFVVVAGAFLGVTDWAAGKVVTLILK